MMRVGLLLAMVGRAALAADGGATQIGTNVLNCRVEQSGLADGGAQFVITVLPLAADAARASRQPDLGAPGYPSRDVLSVQGVPFGKPLKVDASGVPVQIYGVVSIDDAGTPFNINLPSGASTAARQDTSNTSLSSIDAQLALIKAKTDNIDVAFSTRTKPADQQHVIIDSIPSTAVTGPLTDTQLRATPVAVSAAGAATDATLSALLDGGVAALGRQPDGTLHSVAVDPLGVVMVTVVPSPIARGNQLALPCNAVRRTNCR